MSLLDLDQARADYTAWVTGTDDPPTLDDEEARLLSHRIAAHHFPNLLAERDQLVEKINALADEWERSAKERATEIYDDGGFADYDDTWTALTEHAAHLRGLVSGDATEKSTP